MIRVGKLQKSIISLIVLGIVEVDKEKLPVESFSFE